MKTYEHIPSDGFETQTERYKKIEALNLESFLVTEGSSLHVLQSLHSIGSRRDTLTSDVMKEAQRVGRVMLAGNMSPLNGYGPKSLTIEERISDAKSNIGNFLSQNNIDSSDVRIMRPERDYMTPLGVVNLDKDALAPDDTGLLRPDAAADMMYTYNHDIVPAARPADCPVVFVTGETPQGSVTSLLHLAWLGVAHGYVEQAKEAFDTLGLDWNTARVQITASAHAESYTFKGFDKYNPVEKFPDAKGMFVGLEETKNNEGEPAFNFGIDVAAEAYEQIVHKWGIDPYQVYLDTSDTASPTVGYSSHSRSHKNYDGVGGENSRDIVLAKYAK